MNVLAICGVVVLCLVICVGVDAWRLSEVKPCVAEATAAVQKLKELPGKYKEKTAGYESELKDLKDKASAKYHELMGEAKTAAFHLDWSKAKELKSEASAEMSQDKDKEEGLRHKLQAVPGELKSETCEDGEAVPTDFSTCLGYLSWNIIVLLVKPAGLPSPADFQPYIEKASSLVSSAGCGSAEALAALLQAGDMADSATPAAVCGLVAFSGAALAVIVGRRVIALTARGEALEEPLMA